MAKFNRNEFKEYLLFGKSKNCSDLVYSILNTLHHICNSGYWYCYCQHRTSTCQMCKIPKIFSNFVNDVDNNIFDYNFLFFYYTKLVNELLKLIDHGRKDCIECFQGEYVFGGIDYHAGTSWSVPLSESIQYQEAIQID